MNTLARRKQLLLAEARVHRTVLEWHGVRWSARFGGLRELLSAGGPWLLAGSAVIGWIVAYNWRSLAASLPLALSFWRTVRN